MDSEEDDRFDVNAGRREEYSDGANSNNKSEESNDSACTQPTTQPMTPK
jgi:uncharacterized protein YdbL (DUF1318 family)